jgi:hypothetical protein
VTHNVGIFDVVTGVFSAIDRIDPDASTGDFAGATGVLYINGKTTDGGATIQAEITGEICFANWHLQRRVVKTNKSAEQVVRREAAKQSSSSCLIEHSHRASSQHFTLSSDAAGLPFLLHSSA